MSLTALSKLTKVYNWVQISAIEPVLRFLRLVASKHIYDPETIIEILVSLKTRLMRAQRTGSLSTVFLLVDILGNEIEYNQQYAP